MHQNRFRSRRNDERAAVREAVLRRIVAVKCKSWGQPAIAPLPVRAVFPASSISFKVCSLDCSLLFHTSWNAIEAEAMEEPPMVTPPWAAATKKVALPGRVDFALGKVGPLAAEDHRPKDKRAHVDEDAADAPGNGKWPKPKKKKNSEGVDYLLK